MSECAFPFEGNWNAPVIGLSDLQGVCLNVPSRLKGIEIRWNSKLILIYISSECAFPFEGNWNQKDICRWYIAPWAQSECVFPFEGNWNFLSITAPAIIPGLNVPSRLKGIETHQFVPRTALPDWSECAFPFEGNWNLDTAGACVNLISSLNVPSRLKGIETWLMVNDISTQSMSECAFPFEGNWNWVEHRSVKRPFKSECAFPFEGNWNISVCIELLKVMPKSECAFPFEGNWNCLHRQYF